MAILASRGKYKTPRHIQLINQKLQDLTARKIRRLAVFMPPRHAKSTMCSLAFPAWYLGKNPSHRFVLATHTANFASLWGGRVRDLVCEYGEQLWGVKVRSDSKAQSEWELAGYLESGMVAVGVGTAVTGRGANVFAIDDPVADAEKALSPTIRDKQWDWYCSVVDSRLEPNAIEVVLMTLWHPDDLGCRILKAWQESPMPFEVLRFPAIAETDDILGRHPGEALWPERYNEADLEEKKRKSSFWWDALYQQHPTPEGGAIYKTEWFKRFVTVDQTPGRKCWKMLETGQICFQPECVVFIVVDPALGKSMHGDDTAICVFAYHPKIGDVGTLFVLHAVAEIIPIHELIERIDGIATAWEAQFVVMEANGFQLLLANSARKELKLPVREADPKGRSKLSRAVPAIERAAAGGIALPDDQDQKFVAKFLTQLSEWTGQDGDKDDIVDCVSYAAIDCARYGGEIKVLEAKPKAPLFRRNLKQGRQLFGVR